MLSKYINHYKDLPIQVKASLWFAICSIMQKGLSIITVPLFARLMTTEQYGNYNNYLSWYNLLLVFTSLNLFYGVFNNAMMKYKNNRASFISSMQGLVFTITACVFLLYLVMQDKANEILSMSTPLVLMLFLELLLAPCLHFWMASNRFNYDYKSIVIVTLVKSIANPVLGLILVVFSAEKDVARIASIVIVETIICSAIAILQFYRGKKIYSKEYWKYALSFNVPLVPHFLAGQILSQSDRIMINKMVGNTAVAIYSVAYNIGLLLNIFTRAISGSYTPWFYHALEKKNYAQIRKVTKIIMLLMSVLVIIIMFFGPEIIFILGPSDYKEGMYCIPPVAAGAFFIFLYTIYSNVEYYYEKKAYVLFSSLIASGLNLVLNYFFIRKYGYIAAAYTTLVCYLIYCMLNGLFVRLICISQEINEDIFGINIEMMTSVGIILLAFLMNILYRYQYVRWGIVFVLLLVFMFIRKKIMSLVKEIFFTIKKR